MSEITFTYDRTNQQEFCLVETQGSLETDQTGGLAGLRNFATIERHPNGTATMTIGIHRVPGTLTKLTSPMAVLRKSTVGYQITAIIKEKFAFKTRPDVVLHQEVPPQLPSIKEL